MKAYVFPGQGAQFVGMGKELFKEYPEYVKKADAILGYSIEELCTVDSNGQLDMTQYTQPALFVVSALSYLDYVEKNGKPDLVAGHSLGEYNALFAAGAFSFETGVQFVKKRGELMGNANGGAMAAIVGMDEKQVRQVITKYHLDEVDISNLNTPKQTVIASTKEGIERAKVIFEGENVRRYVPLKVSAAFHSRYMKEAQEQFASYLEPFSFSELEIPVISNYKALPYGKSEVKENLVKQLGSTVRWVESVWTMEAMGCTEIVEIGPGNVLTNMVKKIGRETDSEVKKAYVSQINLEQKEGTNEEMSLPADKDSAYDMVREWNRVNPVGTEVLCNGYEQKLRTRTEAVVLFGHRAAVYMEGYNGYFDLRELRLAR